jgi:putative hydrolase of the HAD superfamily
LKAIIFDYGNVLCTPQLPEEVESMAAIMGLSREQFHDQYWKDRRAYDEAAFEPAEYWKRAGPELEKLIALDGQSWSHPAPIMPAWAHAARQAGLKIALLSNIPTTVRDAVLSAGWLPEFDQYTFSCDLRVTKPATAIYEYCVKELGVSANEALFFDDRPENVRAAEALGMAGILFSSPNQAGADLRRMNVLPEALVATLERADAEN